MIHIEVSSLEMTGIKCSNTGCKHLPEYTNHIIGNNYHIKTGTTVAFIWSGKHDSVDVYCRDCIDLLYQHIKSKLDSKLWIFQ